MFFVVVGAKIPFAEKTGDGTEPTTVCIAPALLQHLPTPWQLLQQSLTLSTVPVMTHTALCHCIFFSPLPRADVFCIALFPLLAQVWQQPDSMATTNATYI